MTPQEQGMIDDLVQRIRSTPVSDKDVDAERYLQQTLGAVPEALYILAQTVLVQQYGLTQAQTQLQARQDEIDQLKKQLQSTAPPADKKGGSFLSKIFGSDESAPAPAANSGSGYQPVNYAPPAQAGYPPPPPYGQGYPAPTYGGPAYGTGPGYAPPAYGAPAYGGSPGGFGSGGGGFLRGALQTAAGVAAGAMVFEGAESLFHGFGGGHEGREFGGQPGETVVNNYYGDEGQRDGGDREDRGRAGSVDSGFYNPDQDASREDNADGGRGFADTNTDSDSGSDDDDTSGFDDSSDNDSSDDSGGNDDSNY